MPIKEKNRIEFIDLAKGVCIFLVVWLHGMPEMGERFEVLSCIRMPLYFCLSGLFYKDYGNFANFAVKKTNNILIPFVAWYLIGYFIYYLGRAFMASDHEGTFHFDDLFFRNEIYNLPIWFLLCLFWSNILFTVIDRLTKVWYWQLAGVLGVAAVGLTMEHLEIFNFLYIGSSMTCMPFFYMGYALKRTSLLYPSVSKKKDFLIMGVCLLGGSLLALLPGTVPRINYYRNEIVAGGYLSIYSCAALLVIGVLLFCKFVKHVPYLSWIGRYSIIVLVTHMWLLDIFGRFLSKYAGDRINHQSIEVIGLVMVLASMLAVIPLCKKFLPHITAQKGIIKLQSKKLLLLSFPLFFIFGGCSEDDYISDITVKDVLVTHSVLSSGDILGPALLAASDITYESVLETNEIYDNINERIWNYRVILPEMYYEDTAKFYPVLYLLHGKDASFYDWSFAGGAKPSYDYCVYKNLMPEIIVVMPEADNTYYVNDYFENIKYEKYFIEQFIPQIESKYRIKDSKMSRMIAGNSMGGYGAAYYATKYGDYFGYCYAMSGALEGKESELTPSLQKLISDNFFSELPFYTFDIGKNDKQFYDVNMRIDNFFDEMKLSHEFIVREGGHTWDFWKESLYLAYLRIGWFLNNELL